MTPYAYKTKKKWLFCPSNNPNKNNISRYLHCLSKSFEACISPYNNIMLLGDLNVENSDSVLHDFCNVYCFFRNVAEPTCSKTSYPSTDIYPSSIYIFLTNRPRRF